jgi:hypothetical protein
MGMLTNILAGFIVGIGKLVINTGGWLIEFGAKVAEEAKPGIIAAYSAAKQEYNRRRAERKSKNELQLINDELTYFARLKSKRSFTSRERERARELVANREAALVKLREEDEARVAMSIGEKPNEYDAISVDNNNVHVFQSTVGQTFYGKKCPKCGRPMYLQWKRGLVSADVVGIGWGCTGW